MRILNKQIKLLQRKTHLIKNNLVKISKKDFPFTQNSKLICKIMMNNHIALLI